MKITKFGAKVLGVLCLSGLALTSNAQITLTGTSYTQNFNSLATGMPAGWTVRYGATASTLGTDTSNAAILTPGSTTAWASTGGGVKNYASATTFPYFGGVTSAIQDTAVNRSLGVRQVSATNTGVAFVLVIGNTTGLSGFNMNFKLQSLDSTSPRTTTWLVDYATGSNPTTFTPLTVTGTATTGGNMFSNNTVSVSFGSALDNQVGPVYIRIATLTATTGTGNRPSSAIDDVNLTWTGSPVSTNIYATDYTPMGSGIMPTLGSMMVKFDNAIAKGTGNINLYKVGSTTPVVFNVASSDVTVADSTATISLAANPLDNNAQYFVHMDAGAFKKFGGTQTSLAINDSSTWSFATLDTVPPAPITTLNETFTGCINTAMSGFHQYSLADASRNWRCSIYGNGDSSSVYINGGTASGSFAQNDWLISNTPLDFSAMTKPALSFYQNRLYAGDVTRKIKVSTNYILGTDPTTATWTDVNVAALANAPDSNTWTQVKDIDLTAYKIAPFWLAFTYECGTTGAYSLTYDDIMVEESFVNGITPVKGSNVSMNVIGNATNNRINLYINAAKNGNYELQLFDLMGRKVASQNININAGANQVSFDKLNLIAGMYIVRVIGENGFGTVKAVVK